MGCRGNGLVLTELEQRAALPLLPMGRVDSPQYLGKLPGVGEGVWISTDLCEKVTLVPGLMMPLHLQVTCLCKNYRSVPRLC